MTRTPAEINHEIEQMEAEARKIKAWLNDNPNAKESERRINKKLLLIALQDINDLVCELKPSLPYPLNSLNR